MQVAVNDDEIEQTLPRCKGTRNHRLLHLARKLRDRVPADTCPHLLKNVLRRWHERALEEDTIATTDWQTTWKGFERAWDEARVPISASEPKRIMRAAAQATTGTAKDKIKAVCVALGGQYGVFGLSCRDAGDAAGVSLNRAAALLESLVEQKFLQVARPGNRRDAREYRVVG